MTIELNAGQKKARDAILEWAKGDEPAISLTGAAGTGKTTILKEIFKDISPHFTEVIFTALTGKAALRLRELVSQPAMTLHRALYVPPTITEDNPKVEFFRLNESPDGALLVIDEASMITPDLWEDLKTWQADGVRMILVGDPFQLPPVIERNSKSNDTEFTVFDEVRGPVLLQVMRSSDAILRVATRIRVEGQMTRESIVGDETSYYYRVGHPIEEPCRSWIEDPSSHALITWRNVIRMGMNGFIRGATGRTSLNGPEAGEPVLFCRNGQGVLNGEIQECHNYGPGFGIGPMPTGVLSIKTPTGKPYVIGVTTCGREVPMDGGTPFLEGEAWKTYVKEKKRLRTRDPIPITWGYVLTAHKAQGSEYDRVTVYLTQADVSMKPFLKPSRLPGGQTMPFWQRWMYTALTRAKKRVDLVIG